MFKRLSVPRFGLVPCGLGFLVGLVGSWGMLAKAETTIAFGPAIEFDPGIASRSVVAADLDGDGWRDLIVLPHLTVLRNAGAAGPPGVLQFEAPVHFGVNGDRVRVADLNGDSRPELVLAMGNAVGVLENRWTTGSLKTNSFGPPVRFQIDPAASIDAPFMSDVEVGDLDGDGVKDLAAATSLRVVWLNTGNGRPISTNSFTRGWEKASQPGSSSEGFVRMGDVDGDGRMELWVNNNFLSLFFNLSVPGQLAFTNRVVSAFNNGAVDVDLDGLPDVINYFTKGQTPLGQLDQLLITRNLSTAGNPRFAATVINRVPNGRLVGLSDVDGDGRGDFLFLDSTNIYSGTYGVVRNPFLPGMVGPRELDQAPGVSLSKPLRKSPAPYASGLECADLDGDGLPEVLLMNQAGTRVMILPNRSQVEPEVRLSIPARVQPQIPGTVVAVYACGFHIPGGMDHCDLFEGTNFVGSSTTMPALWQVRLGTAGMAVFRAEAVNPLGARFVSPPLAVLIDPLGARPSNSPPVVAIKLPPAGLKYFEPVDLVVEVDASDADGLVDTVELFGVYALNSYQFETNRLGERWEAPYRFAVGGATSKLKSLIARVTDNASSQVKSTPRSLTIYASPTINYTAIPTNALPNPLTGLVEQRVSILNQSSFPVTGLRLRIKGLAPGVVLVNARGYEDGVPFVQHDPVVAPGGRVNFVLEYLVPLGITMAQPRFESAVATVELPVVISGEPVQISAWSRDSEGRVLLEFPTVAGRMQGVQFSQDLRDWATSFPLMSGDGQVGKWLDQGPPRTPSSPLGEGRRFYRVLRLP